MEGTPVQLAIQSDQYFDTIYKTMKDDECSSLNKNGKRSNVTKREMIEWKVNLKYSKLTNEQQVMA